MVVANGKVPFAMTVSLSEVLSSRTSPLPLSPLTVALIVKGPPVPVPELRGRPLQAKRTKGARNRETVTADLEECLIAIYLLLWYPAPDKLRTIATDSAFP